MKEPYYVYSTTETIINQESLPPCKSSKSGTLKGFIEGRGGIVISGSVSPDVILLPPKEARKTDFHVKINVGAWAGAEVCAGLKGTYTETRVLYSGN